MTTFAKIRNATGFVEDYRQEADDWSAPAPKFGPDAEFRFVPVVELPLPEHDAATQMVVPAEPELTATELRRGWTVAAKPAPVSVKLHALRSVFGLRGFTTKIDRAIGNLPEPNKTIAANHWNYGDEIRRDHPLVSALAGILSLTDAEADEIFRDAQTIVDGGVPDTKPEEATLWERLTSLFS